MDTADRCFQQRDSGTQGLRQAGRQQTLLPRLRRIAAAFEVKEREDRPHRFPQRPRGSLLLKGFLQSS